MTTPDLEQRLEDAAWIIRNGVADVDGLCNLLREAAQALSTARAEGYLDGFDAALADADLAYAWKYRHELLAKRFRELQEKYDRLVLNG